MRSIIACLLFALAALGFCQPKISAKDFLVTKKMFMILKKEVKAELKITPEQTKKFEELFGETVKVEGDRVRVMMSGDVDLDEMSESAVKVLNEDQRKRLSELWIQQSNGSVLADSGMAKKLNLDKDQNAKIAKIVDETGGKIEEIVTDHDEANAKERGNTLRALQKAAGEKMLAVLTTAQRKIYDELKGKPIVKKKSDQ